MIWTELDIVEQDHWELHRYDLSNTGAVLNLAFIIFAFQKAQEYIRFDFIINVIFRIVARLSSVK